MSLTLNGESHQFHITCMLPQVKNKQKRKGGMGGLGSSPAERRQGRESASPAQPQPEDLCDTERVTQPLCGSQGPRLRNRMAETHGCQGVLVSHRWHESCVCPPVAPNAYTEFRGKSQETNQCTSGVRVEPGGQQEFLECQPGSEMVHLPWGVVLPAPSFVDSRPLHTRITWVSG